MKLLRLSGSDPFVARKLYKVFMEIGLKPKVAVYSICVPMINNTRNKSGVFMAENLEEKILRFRIMPKSEFRKMLMGLRDYSENSDGLVLYATTFRVWSRK